MDVKTHYDQHLGNFYSWMAGDFGIAVKKFVETLQQHEITPNATKNAIDLGAGHGVQSVALSKSGFAVMAIDFNQQLLNELSVNTKNETVQIAEGNMLDVAKYGGSKPELIVCWGDTLTHLVCKSEVESLISNCYDILVRGGKVFISFRDYSHELTGDDRLIPVKSDESRILTCILNYTPSHVYVTDLLHEKQEGKWIQKVSTYPKIRISKSEVESIIESKGFEIKSSHIATGIITILAEKP